MNQIRTSSLIANARSFLFVPGDRSDRFAKALASPAGMIILDLEDAVSSGEKARARAAIAAFNPIGHRGRVLVRINAADTKDFEDDVATCAQSRIDGLILSKAESGFDVQRASSGAKGLPVLALIESARGLGNVAEIAAEAATKRLAFGSIDFCLDLGIAEDGPGLAAARSELVLRSRLAGLPAPIEGVTAKFKNPDVLAADIHVARLFGFGGKLAIHPDQLEAIDAGFMPTETEIRWARGIVAAAADQGGQNGSIAVGGEMIDKPVLLRATRILERIGK